MTTKPFPTTILAVSFLLTFHTLALSSEPNAEGKPPQESTEAATELPPLPDGTKSGFVEVDAGRLFYDLAGKGPTLVLLHDRHLHREAWAWQFSDLSQDYQVLRYDRRGYGKSQAPREPYSNVADLRALLDALSIKHATLIGASHGGGLAIEFAIEHPEMVDALVLSGSSVRGLGVSSHHVERLRANYRQDLETTIERWLNDKHQLSSHDGTAFEQVSAMLKANPANFGWGKHRLEQAPDECALGLLDRIEVPTLVLVGEVDSPDAHARAGAIEAGILGARRHVIPDGGQWVFIERPDAFTKQVREFLSLIDRRLVRNGGPSADHGTSNYVSGYVPSGTTALYYEAKGSGEPVILMHAGYMDRRMWDAQFDEFSKQFRVVRFDFRGYGLSKGPSGPYCNYKDLLAVLDHLHIDKAHLIGLSMGGETAIDFAITHPDRVLSIIPVAPGLSGHEFGAGKLQENHQQMVRAIRANDYERTAEFFIRSWLDGPERTPDQIDPALRKLVKSWAIEGLQPGKNVGRPVALDPPAKSRLAEIKAETLVIYGDIDMPDILTIADLLDSEVPKSEKHLFRNVAHMVNLERPDEFNRVVLDFLGKNHSK